MSFNNKYSYKEFFIYICDRNPLENIKKNMSFNSKYSHKSSFGRAIGLHFVDCSIYLKHFAAMIVQDNLSIDSRTLTTSWFFFSPANNIAHFLFTLLNSLSITFKVCGKLPVNEPWEIPVPKKYVTTFCLFIFKPIIFEKIFVTE